MASTVTCDVCNSEPASLMQSNVANGDTLAVGDSCIVMFYLTIVQTALEDAPAEIVEQYRVALTSLLDAFSGMLKKADSEYLIDENPVTGDIETVTGDDEAVIND